MLVCTRNSVFRQAQSVRSAVARFISTSAPASNDVPLLSDPQKKIATGTLVEIVGTVSDLGPNLEQTKKWRVFHAGDFLKPSDLTPSKCINQRIFSRRPPVGPSAPKARHKDMFHQLDLDPVDFALNPSVLHAYVSEMGKIYGRNITGLTSRSQRRLGKAIRRARMIGVLPQLSRPSRHWVTAPYRSPK